MFRSQKHPVVLEKRYAKVLSQWGCHKVTEVSRVVSDLGMQHASISTSQVVLRSCLGPPSGRPFDPGFFGPRGIERARAELSNGI